MTPEVPFTLTPMELASPLWRKLMERCERRIERLHIELEGDHLDASQTANRRGRIKELRLLIDLSEPIPAAPE